MIEKEKIKIQNKQTKTRAQSENSDAQLGRQKAGKRNCSRPKETKGTRRPVSSGEHLSAESNIQK